MYMNLNKRKEDPRGLTITLESDYTDRWQAGHIQVNPLGAVTSVKVLIAGDFCPMGRVESLILSTHRAEVIGYLTEIISDQDLSIVNIECPLTRSETPLPKTGPNLRADPGCAVGIRRAGFDVVTLANNHILDMGEPGFLDTLTACKQAGLKTVGAGRNLAEATRPLIIDVKGVRVAILALAEHEFSIATSDAAGAWPLDPIDNYYQIIQVCQQADFVLVVLHGGNENYPLPSPRMVKTCRYFVDLGVNAVVCHHAHVASGLEVYCGAPIVYSTGNLLFDWPTPRPAAWYTGYMVELTIQPYAVASIRLLPYHQCNPEPGVRPMGEAEAKLFLEEIARLSEIIAAPDKLEQAWLAFCASQRLTYRNMALCLNWVERRLSQIGLRPWWRASKKQIRTLCNLVRCESHRRVLIQSLMDS